MVDSLVTEDGYTVKAYRKGYVSHAGLWTEWRPRCLRQRMVERAVLALAAVVVVVAAAVSLMTRGGPPVEGDGDGAEGVPPV